jgi:hypothetical protein
MVIKLDGFNGFSSGLFLIMLSYEETDTATQSGTIHTQNGIIEMKDMKNNLVK